MAFIPLNNASSYPLNACSRLRGFVDGYFDLKNHSPRETTLKVISYVTFIFPVLVLIAKIFLNCCQNNKLPLPQAVPDEETEKGSPKPNSLPTSSVAKPSNYRSTVANSEVFPKLKKILPSWMKGHSVEEVVNQVPAFAEYRIGQGTRYAGTKLTGVTVRPANLLWEALLGENATTMPGSGEHFAFLQDHSVIRKHIFNTPSDQVVSCTARGKAGAIASPQGRLLPIADLSALYGNATFQLSFGELKSTLQSQRIYTAPFFPRPFYQALKKAMQKDGIVFLPGNDHNPCKVKNLATDYCQSLLRDVQSHWAKYGFESEEACDQFLDLTLYQIGSLVVKTEDFRIILDSNGKIRERKPGEKDAVRLINACGIRGLHATPSPINREIMQQTFATSLQAAESGFVVFPAVGMGVWGGDPDLYWKSFFEAVITSGGNLEQIFVNPGHQKTPFGDYKDCHGEEFQTILNSYIRSAKKANDPAALANLRKITNLFEQKTDLVHLSHQLKVAFPDKIVSLFNASDPDVTLGNHVGEYVNHLNHPSTTEENYTALGTNGICFETITGVHRRKTALSK